MPFPPDRRALLAGALSLAACARVARAQSAMSLPSDPPQPVLFLGHGSPLNALEDNRWSRAFRALGAAWPRPRAILCVSAHWFVRGSFVTAEERPRTIHDFAGFPPELYAQQYPAPGAPELAQRVRALAGVEVVRASTEWGLDHGSWSVLCHLFPAADVPVVQLSLDATLDAARHLELARRLAPLAAEGVLVLGSGNVVHNLRDALVRARRGDATRPEWAESFDADVARACQERDLGFLTTALESRAGRSAHPTPEHYLPLLYCMGAASAQAPVSFPLEGFEASLSMRAVRCG